jgi:uncharacterized membrane protein
MSTSQRAGVIAASASVPRSLVPLVHPRSAVDQGLITGLTAAMTYSFATVAHEASRGIARGLLTSSGGSTDPASTTRMTMAVNLTALGASSAVYAALPYRKGESVGRALTRAIAHRMVTASAAGLVAASLDKLPGQSRPVSKVMRSAPVVIAVGAGVSGAVQHVRSRPLREGGAHSRDNRQPPIAKSIAIGALTATGAVTLAAIERRSARGIGVGISKVGGGKGQGAIFGHLVSLGVIGAAVYGIGLRYFRRAEKAISTPDPSLSDAPESSRVSGGTGSMIAWNPLTREARRHLATITPAGRITSVMGESALDPIRVYIGLTSAPTIDERVRLALKELDRTGALDRSLLVLCSPTGSGFINYTASAAWEYLSRGDCASVTLQYSSRPSWLSLDRVADGREQNRAMWTALARVLAERDLARRPRVVLFGESLGAHTSQDAFLHTGTRGLRELGIERALWLGIPQTSRWSLEVRDPTHPGMLPGEILRVASVDELDGHDRASSPARYVLVAHHDDAVTLFSPSLLVEQPWWLGDERPPAVPPQASFSSPTTFLQAAVDAKNAGAMAPGEFGSRGHDYRGDAARAIRFAFDLPASDAQMAAIEEALREEERERVSRWPQRPDGPKRTRRVP